jgi:hypothetical protein
VIIRFRVVLRLELVGVIAVVLPAVIIRAVRLVGIGWSVSSRLLREDAQL